MGEVSLRHRADHTRNFGRRLDKIADQAIDRLDAFGPGSARGPNGYPLGDLSVFADRPADSLELADHLLIEFQDVVERVGDLARNPYLVHRHPDREVPLLEGNQSLEKNIGLRCLRAALGALRGLHTMNSSLGFNLS